MALEVLKAENLTGCAGVRHGFFSRRGGVSAGLYASLNCGFGSGDQAAHVAENRARCAAFLGIAADRLVTGYQIHSAQVAVVAQPWRRADAPKVDGLVTAQPHLAIGILTADCGPLLFADPDAGIVAAAHAGWKGAISGVAEATLDKMIELGAKRSRIRAAIGPLIGPKSYEVGEEFRQRFVDAAPGNADFFAPGQRPRHFLFDLGGYIARRLAAAGIADTALLPDDTYAQAEQFYSYRRSCHEGAADYGRNLAAIAWQGRV